MYISEQEWDRKLGIVTTGLDQTHADLHHNAYEPTPYPVLNRLVDSGYVKKEGKWIDYGCGKGRVSFFLHARTGCRVTGVEYEPSIYEAAVENHKGCGKPEGVAFVCASAESYEIGDADHFFFFNPFSVPILKTVLSRILESYYKEPRTMRFFFYYPTEDYVSELMNSQLSFVEKLDCMDLFAATDQREHILVFEMNGLQ